MCGFVRDVRYAPGCRMHQAHASCGCVRIHEINDVSMRVHALAGVSAVMVSFECADATGAVRPS